VPSYVLDTSALVTVLQISKKSRAYSKATAFGG